MADQVHVRKRKDAVWRVREISTVPNWAVVELLRGGETRSEKEIYAALGKQFTRKTIIASLRALSLETRTLEPQHVKTEKGYGVGYSLYKHVIEAIQPMKKLNAQLEKR